MFEGRDPNFIPATLLDPADNERILEALNDGKLDLCVTVRVLERHPITTDPTRVELIGLNIVPRPASRSGARVAATFLYDGLAVDRELFEQIRDEINHKYRPIMPKRKK